MTATICGKLIVSVSSLADAFCTAHMHSIVIAKCPLEKMGYPYISALDPKPPLQPSLLPNKLFQDLGSRSSTLPSVLSHTSRLPDSGAKRQDVPVPTTCSVAAASARASSRLSPSTHHALTPAWTTLLSLNETSSLRARPPPGKKGG